MLEGITQKQTHFGKRAAQEQTIIGNKAALMEEIKSNNSNKLQRYRKQRRAIKRECYNAYLNTESPAFETSQGTSCYYLSNTLETPVGTSCPDNGPNKCISLNHNIISQMITITVNEQKVPYDMIIGRKSIKEYNLLRFDTDLCQAGMNSSYSSRELTLEETAAMRQSKPHQLVSDEEVEIWKTYG